MQNTLLSLFLLLALPLYAEQPDEAPATPEVQTEPTSAGDHASRRLADLRALPLEGDKLTLMTSAGETFALYLANSGPRQLGAIILLHDTHKQLIDPPMDVLRIGLSQHGWDTLAIQLPERAEEEDRLSWLDRSMDHIDAALGYLEGMDGGPVVLLGHGSGALLAVDWLFNTSRDRVLGVVVMSMDGSANPEPRLDAPRQLAQVNIPILDIQAMHDRAIVRQTAERRAREVQRRLRDNDDQRVFYRDIAPSYSPAKGDKVHYRQLQIPGVDHTYQPNQELLLRTVRGWVQRHAKPDR